MKACLLYCALLTVSLLAFASPAFTDETSSRAIYEQLNDPLKQRAHSIRAALSKSPAVIPFHYGPDGCILLPLQTGPHKLQVVLDTGCAITNMWREAVPSDTKITQRLTEDDSVGVLPNTRLGTIELGDIPVTICARNSRGVRRDAETAAGMLGGNVLKTFDVTINYRQKTVTLADPSVRLPTIPGERVIPLSITSNQTHTSIGLGGQSDIQAGIDTASLYNYGTLAVLKPFIEKSQNTERFARVRKLHMGGIEFSDVVFQIADGAHPEIPTIIGDDILSRYTVTFDYQNKRLIAVSSGSAGATPITDLSSANWLSNEGRLDESIKLFSKVIVNEPELAYLALMGRAYAYRRINAYSMAIQDYAKIIMDKPTSTSTLFAAYHGRAELYECVQNLQKAIQDYDQAIQLCSRALQDAKKEEATYKHSDAMQQHTKDFERRLASVYLSRAYDYSKLNDFRKSELDVERAINLDNANAYAHVFRASLYERAKKYQETVTECTEAIRLKPEYAEAYERRARAFEKLGKADSAERDKATAKRLRTGKSPD
jgi:tetratricopeptide (TPR) repeat protein